MPSMFDPIKAIMTPDMFNQVGQRLGIPGDLVQKGTEIAIPLLTRGVASVAETPEGQVAIADAVKNADTGLLGNLNGFMGSFTKEGGADVLTRLFGDESRVVTGAIKEATGFDISPIMGMAGPLLLGLLSSTAQKEGLDTNGLVKKLKQEARNFDRQTNESAVLVDTVLDKVDEVRKLKASFSPAEWATMRNAPLAAAATVIAAAPSSGSKTSEEIAAALAAIPEAAKDAAPTSLIAALFQNGVDGVTADGVAEPLAAVKHAATLVKERAPDESAAYNKLILASAYAAAQAAKEGGFLGVGAKQVNPAEQSAIDVLAATLGI
jgi:hypothetical protein